MLGHYALAELRAFHLQEYYDTSSLSSGTLQQHHTILHSALHSAQRQDLIPRNVATLVEGKPRRRDVHEDVLQHCWELADARTFLEAAKAAGPQQAAFYALALDSGARRAELCGLKWTDLDILAGTLSITRQLAKAGATPVFGPPKNGQCRTLSLGQDTLALLKKHRSHQAELKLANRTHYQDHGLIFAKEWGEMQRAGDTLGSPLQMNGLPEREVKRLLKRAGVRAIKFHGLRHTCATLMLQANVPIKVVQERLGHKKIEITLNIYAHVLPSMQQDAAVKLGALLYG